MFKFWWHSAITLKHICKLRGNPPPVASWEFWIKWFKKGPIVSDKSYCWSTYVLSRRIQPYLPSHPPSEIFSGLPLPLELKGTDWHILGRISRRIFLQPLPPPKKKCVKMYVDQWIKWLNCTFFKIEWFKWTTWTNSNKVIAHTPNFKLVAWRERWDYCHFWNNE